MLATHPADRLLRDGKAKVELSHTRTVATRTPPRGGKRNELARARSDLSRVHSLSLSLLRILFVPLSFSCFHRWPKEHDGTWRQRTEMPVVGTMRGKWGGSSWKKKDACGLQGWCLGGIGVTRNILSSCQCMK